MPPSRHKVLAILERRKEVADLYVQGWKQVAIAARTGVAQPTICDDLKQIRIQWRESAIRDFDEARDLELQKIDRIEREAWSQKPTQSVVVSGDGAGQQNRKSMKNQIGDPRFLDTVQKCIAQRRALLGLDVPAQVVVHTNDARRMTVEERQVRLDEIAKHVLSEEEYQEYLRNGVPDANANRTITVDEALPGDDSHHTPLAIPHSDD